MSCEDFGGRATRRLVRVFVWGSLGALVACSGAQKSEPEHTGSAASSLLTTPCAWDAQGNLELTAKANEIAYVGFVAGCATGANDLCVVTNAVDTQQNACHVNSAKGVVITGAGGAGNPTEKVIVDYSNGLFSLGKISLVLDTSVGHLSSVLIMPGTGGSNMALGASGLDADTTAARVGGPKLDVAMKWSTTAAPGTVVFQGGAGADTFIADTSGLAASPAGWDLVSKLGIVGAGYPGPLTVSGGGGNDVMAGGAGTNTLMGGAGDDTFLQSSKATAETMQGGDGFDTADYSARASGINVTVGVSGAVTTATLGAAGSGYKANDVLTIAGGAAPATVKVSTVSSTGAITAIAIASPGAGHATGAGQATSGGSGNGAATINVTAIGPDDGAAGEKDDVQVDVERVKGGAGADILDARAVTLSDVVLLGLGGADILRGGAGADDLCGGAGNDRFYWSGCTGGSCPATSAGDSLSGGGGVDTADYGTASGALVVCLNPADATCTAGPQNGVAGAVDVINDTSATACPGARVFKIACGVGYNSYTPGGISYTCGTATYLSVAAGPSMANDIQNLTGHPTAGSTLNCGTLACTVVGGSGADTIKGSPVIDSIDGNGGGDTIATGGGADLVDLTHTGGGVTDQVDCNSNSVTILADNADTLTCWDGTSAYAACDSSSTCASASIIQQ